MIKNIFSVDVEEWYHSGYTGTNIPGKYPSRLKEPLNFILKALKQTNSTATFFVLGEIAEKQPRIVKQIIAEGHEIASHGYNHSFVYQLGPKNFESDLQKSKKILEDITQKRVIGYRAPAWSVNHHQTPWFWSVLKKNGFTYSSSLFPRKTFLYGDSKAKRQPHYINGILEIPPPVFRLFGQRIPFSGGFYFRILPLFLISWFSRFQNIYNLPTVFYIHPRELDPVQPVIKLSLIKKFIHYFGIKKTPKKITRLLKEFTTTSFQNYLNLPNTPTH